VQRRTHFAERVSLESRRKLIEHSNLRQGARALQLEEKRKKGRREGGRERARCWPRGGKVRREMGFIGVGEQGVPVRFFEVGRDFVAFAIRLAQ